MQIAEYVEAGRQALGAVPTQKRVILERFFDESGGMQLVVHAPFGSKINRAWGLALRKRFCVGFGFELQAASNEESIVLSLGPQHSFELGGRLRLPEPRHGEGRPRPGRPRVAALRDTLAVERAARASPRPLAEREEGAGEPPADARERPPRHGVSRRHRVPGDAAGRSRRGSHGPPDRRPDDRGLPHGGDGRGGLPRSAPRPEGRVDRAARRRHRRAVRVRERDPVRPALHVPGRRPPRGAAHAGRLRAAHPRRRGRRTRSASSIPTRSRASARRRGRSPRTPRRCTRRSSGWATSRSRKHARGRRGSTSSRSRGASPARATAGSRRRPRATRRRCCAAGSRRSGPSSRRRPTRPSSSRSNPRA